MREGGTPYHLRFMCRADGKDPPAPCWILMVHLVYSELAVDKGLSARSTGHNLAKTCLTTHYTSSRVASVVVSKKEGLSPVPAMR